MICANSRFFSKSNENIDNLGDHFLNKVIILSNVLHSADEQSDILKLYLTLHTYGRSDILKIYVVLQTEIPRTAKIFYNFILEPQGTLMLRKNPRIAHVSY